MSTQITPVYPPMDGSIRPAYLVDFHITHNPTLPAFVYSEAPGSVVEVSFLEFGRAAHRAAHLLKENEGDVVALIANMDNLLYQTLVAGMMRAGLVVRLFCSSNPKSFTDSTCFAAIPYLPAQLPRGHRLTSPEDLVHAHPHHITVTWQPYLSSHRTCSVQGGRGAHYLAVLSLPRTRDSFGFIWSVS